MSGVSRQDPWENVYTTKGENEVSWFQENPTQSLELMTLVGATPGMAVIDIGGGASRPVDSLVGMGIRDITVLDLSESALAAAHRDGDAGFLQQFQTPRIDDLRPRIDARAGCLVDDPAFHPLQETVLRRVRSDPLLQLEVPAPWCLHFVTASKVNDLGHDMFTPHGAGKGEMRQCRELMRPFLAIAPKLGGTAQGGIRVFRRESRKNRDMNDDLNCSREWTHHRDQRIHL